jgi:hypothetical protein
MPIHDWTRAPAGIFHDFHQAWSIEIRNALNRQMPKGYYALVEQKVDGPEPDVIAVEMKKLGKGKPAGPVATLAPPRTKLTTRTPSDAARYATKANRISVRHPFGNVVAVIEIVSPGNKDTRHALAALATKVAALMRNGIHVLVVDLFPPSPRDPQGIHKAVWDEFIDEPFAPPPDKLLTLVSYQAGSEFVAHIEPVAVGDSMPDMPLYLDTELYTPVPLEATYRTTWEVSPEPLRELVAPPA